MCDLSEQGHWQLVRMAILNYCNKTLIGGRRMWGLVRRGPLRRACDDLCTSSQSREALRHGGGMSHCRPRRHSRSRRKHRCGVHGDCIELIGVWATHCPGGCCGGGVAASVCGRSGAGKLGGGALSLVAFVLDRMISMLRTLEVKESRTASSRGNSQPSSPGLRCGA